MAADFSGVRSGGFAKKPRWAIALIAFATIPGYSALTHWSHSEQRNHWFGYWFGHDMFTPPFGIYPEMDPRHDPVRRHRSRDALFRPT